MGLRDVHAEDSKPPRRVRIRWKQRRVINQLIALFLQHASFIVAAANVNRSLTLRRFDGKRTVVDFNEWLDSHGCWQELTAISAPIRALLHDKLGATKNYHDLLFGDEQCHGLAALIRPIDTKASRTLIDDINTHVDSFLVQHYSKQLLTEFTEAFKSLSKMSQAYQSFCQTKLNALCRAPSLTLPVDHSDTDEKATEDLEATEEEVLTQPYSGSDTEEETEPKATPEAKQPDVRAPTSTKPLRPRLTELQLTILTNAQLYLTFILSNLELYCEKYRLQVRGFSQFANVTNNRYMDLTIDEQKNGLLLSSLTMTEREVNQSARLLNTQVVPALELYLLNYELYTKEVVLKKRTWYVAEMFISGFDKERLLALKSASDAIQSAARRSLAELTAESDKKTGDQRAIAKGSPLKTGARPALFPLSEQATNRHGHKRRCRPGEANKPLATGGGPDLAKPEDNLPVASAAKRLR